MWKEEDFLMILSENASGTGVACGCKYYFLKIKAVFLFVCFLPVVMGIHFDHKK